MTSPDQPVTPAPESALPPQAPSFHPPRRDEIASSVAAAARGVRLPDFSPLASAAAQVRTLTSPLPGVSKVLQDMDRQREMFSKLTKQFEAATPPKLPTFPTIPSDIASRAMADIDRIVRTTSDLGNGRPQPSGLRPMRPVAPPRLSAPAKPRSIRERLAELDELRRDGVISTAEYGRHRRRILGQI